MDDRSGVSPPGDDTVLQVHMVVMVLAGPMAVNWLFRLICTLLRIIANVSNRFFGRDEAGGRRFPVATVSVAESTIGWVGNPRDIQSILVCSEGNMVVRYMYPEANSGGGTTTQTHHLVDPEVGASDSGASTSHGGNMRIDGSEQQDLYFDKGWALANLCCCVQLGGLNQADLRVGRLLPAACYIGVAAAALLLSLSVLVGCNSSPRARKFVLILALFFLFLDYWIIKPLMCTR